MFTWPYSEHSQVPLSCITLRYSCHQSLALGAEMVRLIIQRQGYNKRDNTNKTKQKKDKGEKKMCGSTQATFFISKHYSAFVKIQQATAE